MAFYSGGNKQIHVDAKADIANLRTDTQIFSHNIRIEF